VVFRGHGSDKRREDADCSDHFFVDSPGKRKREGERLEARVKRKRLKRLNVLTVAFSVMIQAMWYDMNEGATKTHTGQKDGLKKSPETMSALCLVL